MAKISELNNEQLDQMLSKHEKILKGLVLEKEKRTGQKYQSAILSSLMPAPTQNTVQAPTPQPIPQQMAPVQNSISPIQAQQYYLQLDQEILLQAEENVNKAHKEATDSMSVGLTKVLKLSKDELDAFNKNAEKLRKKANEGK